MFWLVISLLGAMFLAQTTESAPTHAVITLQENDLDLWMDEEGRLNLNMSNGAVVRVTSWTKDHLNMEYQGKNNVVTLQTGSYLDCMLSLTGNTRNIMCNRTGNSQSVNTTSSPSTKDKRDLEEKDIIGIIVAVVLTALVIIVVAILICRGVSKKQRQMEETGGTANEAFNSHLHKPQENATEPSSTAVVIHPEPNGNRQALSTSVEGLISAPDTPTIKRKSEEPKTNSTYL